MFLVAFVVREKKHVLGPNSPRNDANHTQLVRASMGGGVGYAMVAEDETRSCVGGQTRANRR